MKLQINKPSLEDIKTIQHIGKHTFFGTFSESNTEEDMSKYLEENFTEEKVKTEVSNPESLFFISWECNPPFFRTGLGGENSNLYIISHPSAWSRLRRSWLHAEAPFGSIFQRCFTT